MSKAETRKFTMHFDLKMTDVFGVPDEIVGYRFKKMVEKATAESSFCWDDAKITIEFEEKEKENKTRYYEEKITVDKPGFYKISHNLKGYPIVSIRDKNGKEYLEIPEDNEPCAIPIDFDDENTLYLRFRVGGFSGTVYCFV